MHNPPPLSGLGTGCVMKTQAKLMKNGSALVICGFCNCFIVFYVFITLIFFFLTLSEAEKFPLHVSGGLLNFIAKRVESKNPFYGNTNPIVDDQIFLGCFLIVLGNYRNRKLRNKRA